MAEHKPKHGKHKPRTIITHRHDDGTYSHEHLHDDGHPARYAGTSADLKDIDQHMQDHFGGGPEEAAAEPEAEATPAAEAEIPAAG